MRHSTHNRSDIPPRGPVDSPTDGNDARALQGQVTVGAPHVADAEGPEEHEARRVDVGQLSSSKPFQLLEDGAAVLRGEGKEPEPRVRIPAIVIAQSEGS